MTSNGLRFGCMAEELKNPRLIETCVRNDNSERDRLAGNADAVRTLGGPWQGFRLAGDEPRKGFFAGYLDDEAAAEQVGVVAGGTPATSSARARTERSISSIEEKNMIRRSGENIAATEGGDGSLFTPGNSSDRHPGRARREDRRRNLRMRQRGTTNAFGVYFL
ncbi:hypothetical protein [Bradyrhizobium sp. BRP22]|uniref:hypothetical protein n=1 Tax=Bradyrhizobium sp. BRP22 TaxID=2793821 RepID=UPI00201BA735|nr:hypothetical protein [Bradyrhizobium sp. BRP22]